MRYFLNGVEITSSQFTSNSVNYPSNWCSNSSQADRDALGILSVTEVHPTLLTYQSYGSYTDSAILNNSLTRTYSVVEGTLATIIVDSCGLVDLDVDSIYMAVLGNRATEYTLAKDDATAFKNAGYSGTVPTTIQNWATLNNQTTQWSADNILAASANLLNVQLSLRVHRLTAKSDLKAATTVNGVRTTLSNWNAYIAALRSLLGI
jgi:hypothetical protein